VGRWAGGQAGRRAGSDGGQAAGGQAGLRAGGQAGGYIKYCVYILSLVSNKPIATSQRLIFLPSVAC